MISQLHTMTLCIFAAFAVSPAPFPPSLLTLLTKLLLYAKTGFLYKLLTITCDTLTGVYELLPNQIVEADYAPLNLTRAF